MFYKNSPDGRVWWLDNASEAKGEWVFSFDKERLFNLFRDYPHELTAEQRMAFDEENPFWRDFFRDRE